MRNNCSQVIIENFFEPCVLYLLLKKPSYGYELNKKLKENCSCQTNIGNLYRSLNKLVKQNQIKKSILKSEIGPRKIVYNITPSGKKLLSNWINNLSKQNEIINKLIKNYKKIL